VPDPENLDGVAIIVEADAIITHAQAKFRRINISEAFNVGRPGLRESRQRVKDVHRDPLIDRTKVSLSRSSPSDLLGHRLPVRAVFF
jgi:hypothetical protein